MPEKHFETRLSHAKVERDKTDALDAWRGRIRSPAQLCTRVLEGTDCAGSSTEPSPPLVGALSEVARGRPSGLQLEWRFESGAVVSGYKVDC